MNDKQRDNVKNPPPPPEKLPQQRHVPKEPSHDPRVVVNATKSIKPGDLQKRGK